MSICPFCQSNLSDIALAGGRCPMCGNLVAWDQDDPQSPDAETPPHIVQPKLAAWTPPSTDDPVELMKATIARIVMREAESGENPPKEIPPLMPPAPRPARTASDSGTLDYSVTPPNFDELAAAAGVSGGQAASPSGPTVIDPPQVGSSASEQDSDKKTGRGSVAATIDSALLQPVPPGGKRPSTYDDHRFAATMDSGNISPEDTERVAKLWHGSYSPTSTPRTSLKGKEGVRARDSKLVIKNRALREATAITQKGADYELLNLIGEGGMGVVYAARQASIDRTVAIKMLKPDIAAHVEQREKFLSEAVVTGDLDHPNIVPIYDLGASEAGALFYSMKRVQGTPWMNVIAEKSLAENVEILMKVADAVAFAHSRGVVHRDLKPENVMLGDFGEVLVMDWGLAMSTALFRKADSITQTSSMGGTPAYMAPEMATGPVDRIGPASDVYLLGAILFEIITGKPPHTGKNVMNCLFAAAKNEIQSTEHSGELLEIALRAMSTSPADRPATVQDFQNGIRTYQSHSESIVLSSRAEEDLARAEKSGDYQTYSRALFAFQEAFALWDGNAKAKTGVSSAKLAYAKQAMAKEDFDLGASLLDVEDPSHAELRHKLVAAQKERDSRQKRLRTTKQILAVGAVVFVAVLIGGLLTINSEKDKAVVAQQTAVEEKNNAVVAEGRATAAKTQAEKDRFAAVEAAKKEEIAKKKAQDNETAAIEQTKIAKEQRRIAEEEKNKAEYRRYIATIGLAASKIDENSFDTAEDLLANSPKEFRNWEWGRLSYLTGQSVRSFVPPVEANAGIARPVNFQANGAAKERGTAPIESVAYSSDGTKFVSGSWDGKARIWDVATGTLLLTIPYGKDYIHAVAFSPDGRYVAVGGNNENARAALFNAKTGAPVRKFEGHQDDVSSVAFSHDGRRLLTASYDKKARLYDVNSGKLLKEYFGHTWWVWSAAFSHDEQRIVTASQDGTVVVWNAETGQPLAPFTGHTGPVYAAAFSPDGQYVVSGGYDNRVLVWRPDDVQKFDYSSAIAADKDGNISDTDAKTKLTTRRRAIAPPKFREFEGHTAPVRAVEFSPNGKMVLSAGNDNTIKLWSFSADATGETADGKLTAGKLVKSLRGHASWVRSAVFSPVDGLSILSGGHDAEAKLWSIAGYQEVRVFQERVLEGHTDAILSAAFSKDGRQVVTAGRDRTARTWNFTSGKPIRNFEEGHDYLTTTAAFFPNGKKLLTAAADNSTRVWDLTTGTQAFRLGGRQANDTDKTGRAAVAAISTDGALIVTGSDDNTAKLWNAENGDLVHATKPLKSEVTAVAFSADGQFFTTGELSGVCTVWNTKTGDPIKTSMFHTRKVTAIAFTADGKRVLSSSTDGTVAQWDLATGTVPPDLIIKPRSSVASMALVPGRRQALLLDEDHVVSLWDIDRAQLVKNLDDRGAQRGSQEKPSQLAVSADGRLALWADYEHHFVRIWDLKADRELPGPAAKAGQPYMTFAGQIWSAAFSPDGMIFVTVGGNSARIWDVATASEKMALTPSGIVAAANFSPDGKWVVTGSWDNSARIWDAETGRDVIKLVGHTGFVNSACFSPDGTHVLTGSDDTKAILWEIDWKAKKAKPLVTFDGHEGHVTSAVFSDDGRYVVTGSSDKTARLWDAASGKPLHVYKAYEVPNRDDPKKNDTVGHRWAVLSVAIWQPKPGAEIEKPDGAAKDDASKAATVEAKLRPRIITGSDDNTACIWDLESEKVLFTLAGHTAGVASVAFSPDGKRALTGSKDNFAKLWDATTHEEILTLKAHAQEVTAVAFSSDGQNVLTASRDGTAILWLAKPWDNKAAGKPLAAARP